jgi:hypothetical protein
MLTRLVTLGLVAAAAMAVSTPASACGHKSCTGSTGNPETNTGGEPVPAPAGFALFALAATLIVTRRRNA